MEMGDIPNDADVFDADGERLGNVIAAASDYIVVEQGFFFPMDYYIPRGVIASVEEAVVRLTVTKADALAQGWGVQPNAAEAAESTAAVTDAEQGGSTPSTVGG
ncbi:MAG: hypothetical protein ACR2OO_12225 [Thermomicrobiales bacterium]